MKQKKMKKNPKRANGEGSLYNNEARKRYEAYATVDGKRVKVATGKLKRDVAEKLRLFNEARRLGESVPPKYLTMREFLLDWVETDAISVKASTAQNYRNLVDLYLVPHLGSKKLATLTTGHVDAMIQALHAQGLAPNTIKRARSVLHKALAKALARKLVAENVATAAAKIRVPVPEKRLMSVEELQIFRSAIAGHRLEALWLVSVATGLRPGEALGLSWSDLDTERRTLTVRHTLMRPISKGGPATLAEPKTKKSRRTIDLPTQAVSALRSHKLRQETERIDAADCWMQRPLGRDLIFRTAHGTALDLANVRHALARVTVGSGLGAWTPHELRHTAASLMLHKGVALMTVSLCLGHSSIRETADTYGHLIGDDRADTARAMESLLD